MNQSFIIPDGNCTRLYVRLRDWDVYTASVHPSFERNARLVATSRGVRSLADGETREAALAGETAEYLGYRDGWDDILRRASALIDAASPLAHPLEREPEFVWSDDK